MPKFRFSAAAADGTVITGVETSIAIGDLRDALLDRNLQPISITEKKSILQFEITQKKVKKRDLMHLCRQLAVFLRSGVSVLEALVVLSDETTDKLLTTPSTACARHSRAGPASRRRPPQHPELFPGYAVEILRSAELTGNLDEVLDQLADYLEREIETSQQGQVGARLPACRRGPGGRRLGRAGRVRAAQVPDFFASLNAKLPLPTRMLLAIAEIDLATGALIIGRRRRCWYRGRLRSWQRTEREGDPGSAHPKIPVIGDSHPHGHRGAILPAAGIDDHGRGRAARSDRGHHRGDQQHGLPQAV